MSKVKRYGRGIPTPKKASGFQTAVFVVLLMAFIVAVSRAHMISSVTP